MAAGRSQLVSVRDPRGPSDRAVRIQVFPDDPRLERDVHRIALAMAQTASDPEALRTALEHALRPWYPHIGIREQTDLASLEPAELVWYVMRDGHVGAPNEQRDRLYAALGEARDVTADAEAIVDESRAIAAVTIGDQRPAGVVGPRRDGDG